MKEIYKNYISHYCFNCDSTELLNGVYDAINGYPYYSDEWLEATPRNREKIAYVKAIVGNKVKSVEDAIFIAENVVDWNNEDEIYLDYLEGSFSKEELCLMDSKDYCVWYDTDAKMLDLVASIMCFPSLEPKHIIRICQGDDWRDVARDMAKEIYD